MIKSVSRLVLAASCLIGAQSVFAAPSSEALKSDAAFLQSQAGAKNLGSAIKSLQSPIRMGNYCGSGDAVIRGGATRHFDECWLLEAGPDADTMLMTYTTTWSDTGKTTIEKGVSTTSRDGYLDVSLTSVDGKTATGNGNCRNNHGEYVCDIAMHWSDGDDSINVIFLRNQIVARGSEDYNNGMHVDFKESMTRKQ